MELLREGGGGGIERGGNYGGREEEWGYRRKGGVSCGKVKMTDYYHNYIHGCVVGVA